MCLEKGRIIVIHRGEDGSVRLVRVERYIGPVKGEGQLIITMEGNMALVANYETCYTADCSFIVDGETQMYYYQRATRGG